MPLRHNFLAVTNRQFWHLIHIQINGSKASKCLEKIAPHLFIYLFWCLNLWSINKAQKIYAAVLWPFSRLRWLWAPWVIENALLLVCACRAHQPYVDFCCYCDINNNRSWECISNPHVPASMNPLPSLIKEDSAKMSLNLFL